MVVVDLANATAAIIDHHQLKLSGEINLSTIGDLFSATEKLGLIECVDCSQIKQADSTCLAYLFHLRAQLDKPLEVLSLPEDLVSLVALYNLESLFHFSPSHSS